MPATQTVQTATIIRPEFQLIEVTNPAGFTAQSGKFVACGTIYGRLYFPKGCSFNGTFKGSILSDSRRNQFARGNETFVIEFIASVAQYSSLMSGCAASNNMFNVYRTRKLFKQLQSASKKVAVASPEVVEVPVAAIIPEIVEVVDAQVVAVPAHQELIPAAAAITPATPVITLAPEAIEVVVEPTPVPAPAASSDQLVMPKQFAFLSKYQPTTLRNRVCKRWGIIHAHVSNEELALYTANRLDKLGVPPQAVKNIFKK